MTELRMQRQSIIGKVHVLPKKIYNERSHIHLLSVNSVITIDCAEQTPNP